VRSLGNGLEEIKLLVAEGVEEDDEKSLLYVVMLELVSKGEWCGELYKATMRSPKENMSAKALRLLSKTRSGDA
jgi:hypothetical protein